MTCTSSGAVTICRPGDTFPIRRILHCPTCQRRRRMAGWDPGGWYSPHIICCGCGDEWSEGEMMERPFRRGWRKEQIVAAKRYWTAAGQHTYAEYRDWLTAQARAAVGEVPDGD